MAIKTSSQISIVDVSDGVDGDTGKGVSSVTPEYYLSTSKTTQTGGSWSTTPPTWSSGKYLWVRQIVTYTDSSVSRTQPYCDTSWEAVNDVQVGGTNIATGTATMTIGTGGHSVGHWRKSGTGTIETIDISDAPVASINKGVRIAITSASSQIGICQDNLPLNSGDIYTLSCWIRSNSSSGVPCRLLPFYKSSTDNSGATPDITITDSWKRISFVSVRSPQTTGAYSGSYIYLRPTEVGNYIDVCGIKFEVGNKPTDWSPAPEDVDSDIDEAAKTATNYMNFDDNGLVIGDMTAGTLGKNVLIDADSVDIRKGDTVLASYGEDVIYLGKNNRNATIDFCNGLGKIYNYNGHLALESDYVYIESSTYPHSANISLNATSTGEKIAISAERMDGSANIFGSIIDVRSDKIDIGTYIIFPSEPGGKVFDSRIYSEYGEGTTITGKTTISGTLVLSKTTDASGKANNSPALIVGGTATTAHIEIDSNEIMAKSNGTTPSGLSLNSDGGNVYIGSGGSGNLIGICQIVKMGSSTATIPYQSNRTKALIEFWKTTVGSGSSNPSCTVYDSAYVTGLSSSMTAVSGVSIKNGPDFAFVYSISAAGAITVSGNFSKYRVTYFN